MSPRIVPAVLSGDEKELVLLLNQVSAFAPYVQIDFMDGRFVPSVSAPPESLEKIGLTVAAEAHLMVEQPAEHFPSLAAAGVSRVICHLETLEDPLSVRDKARKLGMEFGVAVNPGGDYRGVDQLAPQVDSVLFMTVEPGFYGSPFLPEVLEKVRLFRHRHPATTVGVDGGVKESNLLEIAAAGADDICVGSAVFRAADPAQAYRHLVALIAGAGHQRENR